MSETIHDVIRAIQDVKGSSAEGITAETTVETLKLDSLDEVEIMMLLEERLGIDIDQAQIRRCRTVAELARAIEAMR